MTPYKEIEVRFLEIDKPALVEKLLALGALDHGEQLLKEIIFYDQKNTWQGQHKMIRLRSIGDKIFLTYKHNHSFVADGTEEIEVEVSDMEKAKALLEATGAVYMKRYQEKKRHSFTLGEVKVEFDTWPKIPTFVELEGFSEQHLKDTAARLSLDWSKAEMTNARAVIENQYGIPVVGYTYYTFDRIE